MSKPRLLVILVCLVLSITGLVFWHAQTLHDAGWVTIQVRLPAGWQEIPQDPAGSISTFETGPAGHPFLYYLYPELNLLAIELNENIGPLTLAASAVVAAIGVPATRSRGGPSSSPRKQRASGDAQTLQN